MKTISEQVYITKWRKAKIILLIHKLLYILLNEHNNKGCQFNCEIRRKAYLLELKNIKVCISD